MVDAGPGIPDAAGGVDASTNSDGNSVVVAFDAAQEPDGAAGPDAATPVDAGTSPEPCTSASLDQPCQAANAWGTCVGVWACVQDAGVLNCTATAPAQEACDGEDNDCDGLTDVVDAGSGLPLASLPGIGDPCSVPGGVGACAQGTVQCVVGGTACVPPAPRPDVPDPEFIDLDCDGWDGEMGDAILVSRDEGADSDGCGGPGEACRSLRRGIREAEAQSRHNVYLTGGRYDLEYAAEGGPVEVADGVSIFGGFPLDFRRGPGATTTRTQVHGSSRVEVYTGEWAGLVLVARLVTQATVIADVDIVGPDVGGPLEEAGLSSFAVVLASNAPGALSFQRVTFTAGLGAAGAEGGDATSTATTAAETMNGRVGVNGPVGRSTATYAAGGPAGVNDCASSLRTGGVGGIGGAGDPTGGSSDAVPGAAGAPGVGDAAGGAGGLTLTNYECKGAGGTAGAEGQPGSGGLGAPSNRGRMVYHLWQPTPGADGAAGIHGNGGGGGGGGAGDDADWLTEYSGGGGGGGGAGGCAATQGGMGGGGGGASVGVFISDTVATFTDVEVVTGSGGVGGAGGRGGSGQPGGAGGQGGGSSSPLACQGGVGGHGGAGGAAGAGGGGAGGPAVGVLAASPADALSLVGITFRRGNAFEAPGGAGGTGVPSSLQDGTGGANGGLPVNVLVCVGGSGGC